VTDQVFAAGAVPWRPDGAHGVVVAIVHRPRYDDWSFPKGKRDRGETDEDCARREVHEETGLQGELGAELPALHYVDNRGRDKTVRYWAMAVTDAPEPFAANDEVDELRWVSLAEAAAVLSYPRDVTVLDAFARSLPG
jgi:8-oxo-dGTP pyrophosphatase MutT (NUDIX family)